MMRILDTLDGVLTAGHVVYLHCWGGIGRTGTVVGCHLVRRGMTGEQALAAIARMRQDTPDESKVSPETPDQTRLVLRWSAGM
jgi:protein-tyrosine phosphatase